MSLLHIFILALSTTAIFGLGIDERFSVIGRSGVPAMHAALMSNGKVMFLDKIENYTELRLDNGHLAYSSLFDPTTGNLTPLPIETNPFCCGGAFLEDGRLATVGGNGPLTWLDPTVGDGFDAIRYLSPTSTRWIESTTRLSTKRWYPSTQVLQNGRVFVAASSLNGLDIRNPKNNNPTYEILDKTGEGLGESYPMEILVKNQPY